MGICLLIVENKSSKHHGEKQGATSPSLGMKSRYCLIWLRFFRPDKNKAMQTSLENKWEAWDESYYKDKDFTIHFESLV